MPQFQQMKAAIIDFSKKEEHSRSNSAVVVVLTHGLLGYLCGTDARYDERGQLYGVIDVNGFVSMLNAQNCSNFKGKPKLFFLQACRGGTVHMNRKRLAALMFLIYLFYRSILQALF